jgi:hypothetical protein
LGLGVVSRGLKTQIVTRLNRFNQEKNIRTDVGKFLPTFRKAARVSFDEGIVKTINYFRGCLERGELGERLQ